VRSLGKIIIGLAILLISLDGLRVAGADALGGGLSLFFAMLGVGVPFAVGIFIRRSAGLMDTIPGAALALWPLCIMRIWPLLASLKQWGYSYSLAASEKDVVAFILYLCAISAWAFLFARTINSKKDVTEEKGNDKNFPNLLWFGLLIGFIIILAVPMRLAMLRHATFHSKAWDLAIFSQLAFNMLHGNGLEVSVRGIANILSDHFSPIMFPAALLSYVFGGSAKGLIILQAIAVGSGIIPIALIARRRSIGNPMPGIFAALIYALYAPLTFLLLDDFHPIALIVPLFLWAFYFLEIKRMWTFYIFLILAGCCQEEGWIIVGMVGAYLAIFRGMRRAGIITLILSWTFFFYIVMSLIPSFRPEGDYFYIHRYAYLGSSASEIAKNIFLHPGLWLKRMFDPRSIAFVLMMLAPLGFLPLRRPKILFILIPTVFYTLISGYDIQRTIFHQYTAPFIPFLMLAMLDNFTINENRKTCLSNTQITVGALWCGLCGMLMLLMFPISGFPGIYGNPDAQFDARLDKHFVELISEDAKVSTISKYAPHLSNRKHLTLFPNIDWDNEWPDVILIDGKELHTGDERQLLAELLYGENDGPTYNLSHFYNGIFLLEPTAEQASWGRIINSSTPGTDDLIRASGGEAYKVGKCKAADLVLFTAGSNEFEKMTSGIAEDLYWLKLQMEVSGEFGYNWFISVRCEDEEGNVLFTHHHFPLYGPLYVNKSGEIRPFRIFNRSPKMFTEAYVIDGKIFSKSKSHGSPAFLRILPIQLQEGWTNTLDEYMVTKELSGDVHWDSAFVVDLQAEKN